MNLSQDDQHCCFHFLFAVRCQELSYVSHPDFPDFSIQTVSSLSRKLSVSHRERWFVATSFQFLFLSSRASSLCVCPLYVSYKDIWHWS